MNIRNLMGSTALRFGAFMAPPEDGGAPGGGAPAAGGGAPSGGAPGAGGGAPAGGAPGAGGAPAASGGANGVRAFADTLPEKIRGEAAFKDIKDLDGLANGYLHAQRMLGRVAQDPNSVVALPGADDADGLKALYAKLGRPEAADQYQIAKPATGDYSDSDKAFQAKMLPILHEAGLTQRQLDQILPAWNEMMGGARQQLEGQTTAAKAAGEASLRQEYGLAYDERLGDAKAALAHYGNPQLVAEIEATGAGNNPELIKVFAKMGQALREDGLIGRSGGGSGLMSPTEAQQQINALYADKDFARIYRDKSAVGHADAVKKMQALFEQAHPSA